MTAVSPNETSRTWRQQDRSPPVQLYLADRSGTLGSFVGARVSGFPLSAMPIELATPIDPSSLAGAAAAVIEVSADDQGSIQRFAALAAATHVPLVAAVYNPPLALVRSLVRAGAHDVVPLPLDLNELETSLEVIRDRLDQQSNHGVHAGGKVVSVIKSAGGVGATSLLGQIAIRAAEQQAGLNVCLMDLDIQFGDLAFQLGLQPSLSLAELLEAGSRMDGELLGSVAASHPSGVKVIASPPQMMPLEAVSSDQVLEIVELAAREFGIVFIDLPSNWTNWSLSILARSDIVMLATELSVPALNRARRQIELLRSQDLAGLNVQVIVNRYEKGLSKNIRPADVRQVLGQDVGYTIANEPQVMRSAIDRGVPIAEIKKRSAVGKDIGALAAGLSASLGLEH